MPPGARRSARRIACDRPATRRGSHGPCGAALVDGGRSRRRVTSPGCAAPPGGAARAAPRTRGDVADRGRRSRRAEARLRASGTAASSRCSTSSIHGSVTTGPARPAAQPLRAGACCARDAAAHARTAAAVGAAAVAARPAALPRPAATKRQREDRVGDDRGQTSGSCCWSCRVSDTGSSAGSRDDHEPRVTLEEVGDLSRLAPDRPDARDLAQTCVELPASPPRVPDAGASTTTMS